MILTCQECKATYCLADKVIGPEGKMVKCAKCHYVWFAQDPNKSEDCNKSSCNVVGGLLVSSSIMFLVLLSLSLFPEVFIKFKPLEKLYASCGVYNSKNIAFDEVELLVNGSEVIIKGSIINLGSEEENIPDLRYELLNEDKQVIFKSTAKLDGAKLKPNDLYNINSKIINIPDEAIYLKMDLGNRLELMWR